MIGAVTIIIFSLNLAVYLYASMTSGNILVTDLPFLLKFGLVNRLFLAGCYWQILTSIFVHINIVHLAFNMIFMLFFGGKVEEIMNGLEYIFTYIISGVTGNIFTIILAGTGTLIVSAGASGAIFGIIGAYIIYLGVRYDTSIMFYIIYCLILLLLNISVNVNLIAHASGLLTGAMIGYVKARNEKELKER